MPTPKKETSAAVEPHDVDLETGEIITYDPRAGLEVFKETAEIDTLAELLADNTGGVLDLSSLPRITIPAGGAKAWTVPTIQGERHVTELDLVVLWSGRARAWWKDELGEGDKFPACSSSDGVVGIAHTPDGPGLECAKCPYAQWGSSTKSERGQACREFRQVAALVLPHLGLTILRLAPTSIKAWDAYTTLLTSYRLSVHEVVTRVALERQTNRGGIEYAVAAPTAVGRVDAGQIAAVKATAKMLTVATRPSLAQVPVREVVEAGA